MSDVTQAAGKPPEISDVFDRTYLLLRWSMPMLLLWLFGAMAAAWIEVWRDRDDGMPYPMTSISAYYYTDAQPVFVGVLIGLGVLLIVIQGRTQWEDALMNTAGALAPFVALLPTPVDQDPDCTKYYCTAVVLEPAGLVDGAVDNHELIDFNIWAVAPIWALLVLYLSVRAVGAQRRYAGPVRVAPRDERNAAVFSAAFLGLCGVTALVMWLYNVDTRQTFYDWAHLTSAATMIALLLISIIAFTRSVPRQEWAKPPPRLRSFWPLTRLVKNWFGVYFAAAILLLGACIAIVLFKSTAWNHAVLVIEAAALVPFAAYWIFQGVALRKHDRHASEAIATAMNAYAAAEAAAQKS